MLLGGPVHPTGNQPALERYPYGAAERGDVLGNSFEHQNQWGYLGYPWKQF